MKYTHEQQEIAIEKACDVCQLGSHIFNPSLKSNLSTWADRIMGRWYRKLMPIKQTFMYCNTLDMNFFFTEDGRAMFTYAGYCDNGCECDSLVNAFKIANEMIKEMQKVIAQLN